MKTLALTLTILLTQLIAFSQTPDEFNYQAVVRDSQGNILANQTVDFKVAIRLNNTTVYWEQHNGINTGLNGLINFKIGAGTYPSSDFSAIDWGAGRYTLRVRMNDELIGETDISPVPIALYAVESADNPWTYNSSDKSLSYTGGMTEVLDLKISGSSNLAAEAGMIRWDKTNKDFLGYNGSKWQSLTENARNEYISNETELNAALEAGSSHLIIVDDFTISKPITITSSLTLTSSGGRKTISTKGTSGITISSSNISIQNINLNSSGGGTGCTITSGFSDIAIENVTMSGFERGIFKNYSSSSTSRIIIKNVNVLNCIGDENISALCLLQNIEYLSIENVVIKDVGKGLTVLKACNGTISNVQISNTKGDGLTLVDTSSSDKSSNRIQLNNISISNTSGIGFTTSNSSISASNISVNQATGCGIKIVGNTTATPVQISNVNISATKVSGTSSYGVLLKDNAVASISDFCISGTSTTSTDYSAVGIYALNSQKFTVNGGIFMKLGKLILVE
ncbi:hypothetical protein [Mangrovibacterium lignilyticum]|uniref:hypothetical protein n=1 Tax=Mangrovibacterium lignilyticum TaxID=2668052 RepID=UPI0013D199A0|nr:hypothetical protein [Mangrovibacterium lignilyticum]